MGKIRTRGDERTPDLIDPLHDTQLLCLFEMEIDKTTKRDQRRRETILMRERERATERGVREIQNELRFR